MTFAEEIEWELARSGKLGGFEQKHYRGIENYEKW